jgi:hypothetical protein
MEVELVEVMSIRCFQLIISALHKIGEDIVIDANHEQLNLRSLNQTKSALPIVHFKQGYFQSYRYNADVEQLVYQVPGSSLISAFKLVTQPTCVKLRIDRGMNTFILGLIDKYNILHEWELFLGETSLLNALYDLSDCTVHIHCRHDVFDGLQEAFHGNLNVTMEANRDDTVGTLVFRSAASDGTTEDLSSTLSIKKSERCEARFSDDVDQLSVAFSLVDFNVAVIIGRALNQRLTIHIAGPGFPLIIKAAMFNQIVFEMALATAADQEELNGEEEQNIEAEAEVDMPNSVSSNRSNHPQSPMESQISPWPRSLGKSVPCSDAIPTRHDDNSASPRSEKVNRSTYVASPPFPLKRRMLGQFAEASQPPSDDSDSDM